MVNWRNTKLPKLEGEDKIATVFEMVINKTYELGFQVCSFTMSSQSSDNKIEPLQFNNYCKEWNDIYKRAHLFDVDPVVTHCKHNVFPFVWEEKAFSAAPNLWDLAKTFGVQQGWTQPVHDFRGVFSMLTLGRSKGEVTPEELYEKAGQVLWMCHTMHAVVAQKYADKPCVIPSSKLTLRETQILKWSAMGKTADEVGSIMSITPRTVGFHVSSAMRKLGVNSKIAAVLRASKAGLFD
ncbi:helix-turn-helix transcriptional regulator [Pseudomonas costantinii]|uniref:LuxR family transcriptional regulator n=1 Tax=Pseudomonas costantinii TaxID=168469 RepID=A0A1S2UVJ5_9PSED|nr:LuxR family transcriptional regulator [Pseudomonas costantinii]OIN50457.1 LuxR family transcriptional regulator [Pseudomonas costantinii]SED81624.1 LuxR family transcriptional regulator [Pseudomonas costantinii]